MAIADQQHVAYEAARELDLMGALEKPIEATHETSSRPLRWGYVAARLVPAVLSAVIGWLSSVLKARAHVCGFSVTGPPQKERPPTNR